MSTYGHTMVCLSRGGGWITNVKNGLPKIVVSEQRIWWKKESQRLSCGRAIYMWETAGAKALSRSRPAVFQNSKEAGGGWSRMGVGVEWVGDVAGGFRRPYNIGPRRSLEGLLLLLRKGEPLENTWEVLFDTMCGNKHGKVTVEPGSQLRDSAINQVRDDVTHIRAAAGKVMRGACGLCTQCAGFPDREEDKTQRLWV